MQRVACIITNYLIKKELIDEENRDFYYYAWEAFLIEAINYLSMFLIAIITGKLIQYIVFVFCFKLLRENIGGIHLGNWFECYVASNIIIFLIVCNAEKMVLDMFVILLIYIVCIVAIIKYAPCEHENNPITAECARNCRNKAIVYCIGIMIITFVLKCLRWNEYAMLCFFSVVLSTVLLKIGKMQRGGENCEKSDKNTY